MDKESKKKLASNFSNNEKLILSELIFKYKDIVENKRTDSTTNAQKVAGWVRLAEAFNNISTEYYRSPNNLKTCWENIKRSTKKEKAVHKKEIFKTGGGRPNPPTGTRNVIVEAVLGPALGGLSNIYDSDALEYDNNEIIALEPFSPGCSQVADSSVINISEADKENITLEKSYDTTSNTEDDLHKSEKLWESWTPKSLKRPISQSLQPSNNPISWMKRRRPKSECSADAVLRERIELFKILKSNAEEEGQLKISILKEQLKQEQIKTEKLLI